ncbi:hypothetical protein TNIN_49611 [Trichonephila inaurata madagascariensis]|uniref:Uncharacterized protein n=1 Tax=Trichonephila inaurata madagascariensis TaxID=2747483 RepID=A0A8X7CRR5_9ARAC|nr:hypothetical protein TNIN_49611 [Trichonephila inaurata madagascariensis]
MIEYLTTSSPVSVATSGTLGWGRCGSSQLGMMSGASGFLLDWLGTYGRLCQWIMLTYEPKVQKLLLL